MIIELGKGNYCVSSGALASSGIPCLAMRRLDKPEEVGALLDPLKDYVPRDEDLLVVIGNREAAAVLYQAALACAFAHGLLDEKKEIKK